MVPAEFAPQQAGRMTARLGLRAEVATQRSSDPAVTHLAYEAEWQRLTLLAQQSTGHFQVQAWHPEWIMFLQQQLPTVTLTPDIEGTAAHVVLRQSLPVDLRWIWAPQRTAIWLEIAPDDFACGQLVFTLPQQRPLLDTLARTGILGITLPPHDTMVTQVPTDDLRSILLFWDAEHLL